jgi:hypothetical protein
MRFFTPLLIITLAGTMFSAAVAKDHGKHGREVEFDREHHEKYRDACFTEEHVRIIREYYHPRSLPPGLEKKLYRTGHLPPGWERRIRPFPVVIEQRLPPVCAGCVRGYMDGYAIVYQPQSRLIIDVHALIGL